MSDTLKARLEAAWREGFGAGRDFAFNVAYNTPTHGEEARWTDSDTRAASALPDEPSAAGVPCQWAQDGAGESTWASSCGQYFVMNDDADSPDDFMNFCCFCGKSLAAVPYVEDSDDE
jgi:hypothetical protein